MTCDVVLPVGHKGNTHQASPVLLHSVICIDCNTAPALRINHSN